jgi:soluble lytic murein transglycosylase-like protein
MLSFILILLTQVGLAQTDNNYIDQLQQNDTLVKPIDPTVKPGPAIPLETARSLSIRFCDDPTLALAIMKVESNFINTRAPTEDSTGIMQIRPSTAQWIGCKAKSEQDLLNIELNIRCGCRYLARLSHQYSKLKDVISAYNAGQARLCTKGILRPSGKSCIIGHYINQDYVNKVMGAYELIRSTDEDIREANI